MPERSTITIPPNTATLFCKGLEEKYVELEDIQFHLVF